MKLVGSASILMLLSSLIPVSAGESRDALQRAIIDLENVNILNKDPELSLTIRSLNNLIADSDQKTILGASNLKNYRTDSNLETLTIMSAPVFFIIVIVCLYAAAIQAKPKAPDRSASFRDLKLASVDFSISDEDFLKIRKKFLG